MTLRFPQERLELLQAARVRPKTYAFANGTELDTVGEPRKTCLGELALPRNVSQ